MHERTLPESGAPTPPIHRRRWRASGLSEFVKRDEFCVAAFLLSHAVLGIALAKSPLLSTGHAGAMLLAGLWWVVALPRLERAAYVAAYFVGAETLWRMTQAALPWEFTKYSVCLMLVLALLRNGQLRGAFLPFCFFALLLPALILPMANVELTVFIQQVSFNLSGPLALAVCVWFFAQLSFTPAQWQRLLLAFLGPVSSVAAIALSGIVTAKELVFIDDSNAALSGGFGPNQVAALLSFGAVGCFLWALDSTIRFSLRSMLFALALYLLGQSVMTFSRGGLYMAVGSILPATLLLLRDRKVRVKLIAGLGVLFLLTNYLILPQLDQFTGGALTKRFSDTNPSGRDEIARADLQVMLEHPLYGVGPGQSRNFRSRQIQYYDAASHTEFTRLLAEHGLFGIVALLVLVALAVRHFYQARTPMNRAIAVAAIAWSFLFLASNAMRLALPSFAFGLSALTLLKPAGAMQGQPATPPAAAAQRLK